MRFALALLAVTLGSACYEARDRRGCLWEDRYYAHGELISEVTCRDGPASGSSVTNYCEDGLVVGTIIEWDGPAADAGHHDAGPRCESR